MSAPEAIDSPLGAIQRATFGTRHSTKFTPEPLLSVRQLNFAWPQATGTWASKQISAWYLVSLQTQHALKEPLVCSEMRDTNCPLNTDQRLHYLTGIFLKFGVGSTTLGFCGKPNRRCTCCLHEDPFTSAHALTYGVLPGDKWYDGRWPTYRDTL